MYQRPIGKQLAGRISPGEGNAELTHSFGELKGEILAGISR